VLSADGGLRLHSLLMGATNAQIVESTADCSKIGIDCAFGWPTAFVDFVTAHSAGSRITRGERALDISWRRELAYRETDRDVIRRTRKQPLSVSTDKLGLVAMRCAVLLEDLVDAGRSADRTGTGDTAEVYPGAALSIWQMPSAGYKQDQSILSSLVDALLVELPIDLGEHDTLIRSSDDAFDALIAAVVTLASARSLCEPVPAEHLDQARREGWIVLPPTLGAIRATLT
jgi:hypothetical protein